MEGIDPGEVRTGAVFEAQRLADRGRLAATAAHLRVPLGHDLVLVFLPRGVARLALEESLRAERIDVRESVEVEASAFNELLGEAGDLAATLYVDVADPVALDDRLDELRGVEDAVSIEVAGRRTTGRSDPGDGGAGAFHLLFALDAEQQAGWRSGAVTILRVDHPACPAAVTIDAGQPPATGLDTTW